MSQRATAFALLTLMPLFYASNAIFGRSAVDDVAPFTLAFLRWFIVFVILLLLSGRSALHLPKAARGRLNSLFWLGVLGMLVCGGVFYVALRYTTATNTSLIYVSTAIIIVVLEYIFLRRQVRLAELCGVLIGFVGVGYIIFAGDWERLKAFKFGLGEAIVFGCAIAWAAYSLVLRRAEFVELNGLQLFALTAGAGSAVLFPFAMVETLYLQTFPTGWGDWQTIFGVALVSALIPFWIFQHGVRTVGPTLTGVFIYLMPVYGMALAAYFLGEQIRPYHLWGAAITLFGVILATAPTRAS